MNKNNVTKTTFGHGGNVHLLSRSKEIGSDAILDFSANINPLGPPEWMRKVISSEVENLVHYPDPDCFEFVQEVSRHLKVPAAQIIPANGTTELLYFLPQVIDCKRAIIPVPSYVDYAKVMEMAGMEIEQIVLRAEDDFVLDINAVTTKLQGDEVVIIGTPNNPTGMTVDGSTLLNLAKDFPQTVFVIDEAFIDFIEDGIHVGAQCDNIISLNSLTKFYAIPGLRLGFGVFPLRFAEKMKAIMPPWTVNSLAQRVGQQLFRDQEYATKSRSLCNELREELYEALYAFSECTVFSSQANYLLVRLQAKITARELSERLLTQGIAIRVCDNYPGLDDNYFRVAVRERHENAKLVKALASEFDVQSTVRKRGKKTRATSIMFQGTSSNAGKSVLTAALCRILLQDGVRVAPFKAQNMSLNSFVTHDGKEMGRAQVVQAQAARLDPDVRMNPVLLKPNSDTGSQIIVRGEPIGNMSAIEYYAYKNAVREAACSSYDELADDYDVIVLEGAGSPGEVNLKNNDIVNMSMAQYAQSPVLLVGDIDRGGVYASFVGTMEVLYEWERRLMAGFIVNRFRGQASLLEDAHRYVKEHTKKDVLGVVPFLKNLGIPEEDSVSFKAGLFDREKPQGEYVDIVLINLPHISNFTDIEPFIEEPDVHLRVVSKSDDIGKPDAIILPGSKNVIGDLKAIRKSGMADAIIAQAERGCEIVGICGGYQIIGKSVKDPHSIESEKGEVDGIGLLNLTTTLEEKKKLIRKKGSHGPSKLPVHGYEIHHGISKSSLEPVLMFEDGGSCGAFHKEKFIWGTYLHGIFDADEFRRWFIDRLRKRSGLRSQNVILAPYDLEPAFDRLAKTVRENIDMDVIYSLLKI